MPTKRHSLLGIPVDAVTEADVLGHIERWISARVPNQIVTVNPEFIIAAQTDRTFAQVLRTATLSVADGIGIRAAATYQSFWAPRWQPARLLVTSLQGIAIGLAVLVARQTLRQPIPATITGVDLLETLARAAATHGWTLYLVGGDPGRAEAVRTILTQTYPDLTILGAEEGIPKPTNGNPSEQTTQDLVARIRAAKPDILLVAFGAPKQDRFISDHRNDLGVPVMMGVGGAFDFIAGTIPRAPVWLRTLGLEWLWRFSVEPWRWRRILTATVRFPLAVFAARQRQ